MKTKSACICIAATGLYAMTATAEASTSKCASGPEVDCAVSRVIIYAGPQSITPGQQIFIAVELEDQHGHSLDAVPVELEISAGEKAKRLTAVSKTGIADFELRAPLTTGRLSLTAMSQNLRSNPTEILVSNGSVGPFDLRITSEDFNQAIKVSAVNLTDVHGNGIETGTAVILNWVRDGRVYKSNETVVTHNSFQLVTACPETKGESLKVEARIQARTSVKALPGTICSSEVQ